VIALLAAAAAATGHAYVLPWGVLFELPAPNESACSVTSLRFGPPDGKWERGSEQKPASCEFRSFVLPGPLVPGWAERADLAEVRITYTVRGSEEPQTVTVQAETLDPAALGAEAASLTATVQKVKGNVRSVVTSRANHPVLLGDAVAARNKPRDDCRGPGPTAVLQNGESLLDVRPGLLSPSMQVWVAVFTGQRKCSWVKAATRHL
jgi:hypothetical protein